MDNQTKRSEAGEVQQQDADKVAQSPSRQEHGNLPPVELLANEADTDLLGMSSYSYF
jgi:hypothetical protein